MAARKKHRNFPRDTLQESLAVAQKIMDEMAGKPFKRLLLAEALGISPGSSNFRYLLSSSYQYGLTEGTEKASDIELTDAGRRATQATGPATRIAALRQAATAAEVFGRFYRDYRDKKMPSAEMLGKILTYCRVRRTRERGRRVRAAHSRERTIRWDYSGYPRFTSCSH